MGVSQILSKLVIFRLCFEMLLGHKNNPVCSNDTWKSSLHMSKQGSSDWIMPSLGEWLDIQRCLDIFLIPEVSSRHTQNTLELDLMPDL